MQEEAVGREFSIGIEMLACRKDLPVEAASSENCKF